MTLAALQNLSPEEHALLRLGLHTCLEKDGDLMAEGEKLAQETGASLNTFLISVIERRMEMTAALLMKLGREA